MTVEQRVKTLEYEMKILKNEVQQMLLDIQEQLLLHYYPSLRTDDTSPSEGIRRSIEAIQKKKAALEESASSTSLGDDIG
jgi:phosphomevalonate kinase